MDAIQVSVNFKIYPDNGIDRHAEIYCKQWDGDGTMNGIILQ